MNVGQFDIVSKTSKATVWRKNWWLEFIVRIIYSDFGRNHDIDLVYKSFADLNNFTTDSENCSLSFKENEQFWLKINMIPLWTRNEFMSNRWLNALVFK